MTGKPIRLEAWYSNGDVDRGADIVEFYSTEEEAVRSPLCHQDKVTRITDLRLSNHN